MGEHPKTPSPLESIRAIREGLEGVTDGPWEWTVFDSSMASMGNGPDAGANPECDHVLTVKACENCARHNKVWTWDQCATIGLEDAEHIARCDPQTMLAICNSHDELVEALEEAIKTFQMLINADKIQSSNTMQAYTQCVATEIKCRKAISRAKSESS